MRIHICLKMPRSLLYLEFLHPHPHQHSHLGTNSVGTKSYRAAFRVTSVMDHWSGFWLFSLWPFIWPWEAFHYLLQKHVFKICLDRAMPNWFLPWETICPSVLIFPYFDSCWLFLGCHERITPVTSYAMYGAGFGHKLKEMQDLPFRLQLPSESKQRHTFPIIRGNVLALLRLAIVERLCSIIWIQLCQSEFAGHIWDCFAWKHCGEDWIISPCPSTQRW